MAFTGDRMDDGSTIYSLKLNAGIYRRAFSDTDLTIAEHILLNYMKKIYVLHNNTA